MPFAIKAAVDDPRASTFTFGAQKTMYGGRTIVVGDEIFVFSSENDGGAGLIARGIVTRVIATPRKVGIERQTPRVSIEIRRTGLATRAFGRNALASCTDWNDGRPGTELNYKLYRQATNKIVGISERAASLLAGCF